MVGHWISAAGDWRAAPKGWQPEARGLQAKALALGTAGCLPLKELRRAVHRLLCSKKIGLDGFRKSSYLPAHVTSTLFRLVYWADAISHAGSTWTGLHRGAGPWGQVPADHEARTAGMEAHAARFEYSLRGGGLGVIGTGPWPPRNNRRSMACASNRWGPLAPIKASGGHAHQQPTHRSRKSRVSFAPLGRGLSGGLFLRTAFSQPAVLPQSRPIVGCRVFLREPPGLRLASAGGLRRFSPVRRPRGASSGSTGGPGPDRSTRRRSRLRPRCRTPRHRRGRCWRAGG